MGMFEKGERYIFWDSTDVNLRFTASAALEQRITYNSYYGRPCVKGGISHQPCGWVRSHHLWSGSISDTMYQEITGILEMQEEFVRYDSQDEKYVAFTMIMEKGYMITVAAWKRGEQTCIKPIFMEPDKIFSTKDVIYTSTIASHSSGNEWNVNLAKMRIT